MRPDILNPLYRSLQSLEGIGPKLEKTLGKLLVGSGAEREARILDLVFHLPAAAIDRSLQPGIAKAPEGAIVTLKAWVDRHQPTPRHSRAPYKVFCHDETGEIALVFFHAKEDWLQKQLPVGETRYVSGKVEWFNGQAQIVHPDHIVAEADFAELPLIEPVYPMTAGLSPKTLRRVIDEAVGLVPDLPEWQDAAWLKRQNWPGFTVALHTVHHPEAAADIDPATPAWSRLAFDEILAGQLALALVRKHMRKTAGSARTGDGSIRQKILAALPFSLTDGQRQAVAEIEADLAEPKRMLRLLQGDVGSGKTVVALMAAAAVAEAGGQTAMMAPTELLARQHLKTITPLAEAAGLTVAVLTGRDKGKERKAVEAALAAGEIDIVVGTHALFQSATAFKNLALAIVDEQHRFGVHQRLALTAKGSGTDVLVMTATPIPRTLVLTYFGDMDVSRLLEKPAGRKPVKTSSIALDRMGEVLDGLNRALADGAKVYWVCPLVEESEALDAAAAEDRYAALRAEFGDIVGLVHGRMKAAEKDTAMADFLAGRTKILVSTTVIEVGVDVPDATIMVIEHAERFGLAQLHQLRGRVGRGDKPSTCLLLYKGPLSETAHARLAIMRETEDGFRIAEEDLKLRGEGEVLGTRQSGTPGFRVARIEAHGHLLEAARDDARLILERDPELGGTRGDALRILLYLFGRDEAVRLLRAG
ncbi:ATP-dependent DNA helicase RecG [Rhodobium orientis]|uniref:ATP-dependent DNA helicase RecG n=1 Tax=Rhodobium orientis TaxID=34017 RepID=A0A327JU27_9HYPH|nr:ATP-dependent DNA helicase RecG [Rhodobium orientis]MBB4302292.1 ATP-dependent DNA helicase RecG [Rhodobium orientis]MBK5949002.1 ATP-dependent DNA helicase RecG [Rhodobium orientis]RAI28994.1 ATP-dependent DNA helicase RecG [Rhodobium orientis]